MCHSAENQKRFYALHKILKQAKQMRELFVCLAVQDTADQPPDASSSAAPAATPPAAPAAPTTSEEEVEEESDVETM